MGIRFFCPNGHKLNVKAFLAGHTGICPFCGVKVDIPLQSTRSPTKGGKEVENAMGMTQKAPGSSTVVAPATTLGPGRPAGGSPAAMPVGPGAAPQLGSSPTTYNPGPTLAPQALPLPQTPGLPNLPQPGLPAFSLPQQQPVPQPFAAASAPPMPPQAPAGPADPLSEAPDAVWYVRPAAGGQYGPATANVMRSWLTEGRIAADSMVWREGWRDWKDAASTFPQLGGEALPNLNVMLGVAPQGQTATLVTPQPLQPTPPKSKQGLIIALLLLAVLILVGVFVWVLVKDNGGGTPSDATDSPPAATAPPATPAAAPAAAAKPATAPSEPAAAKQ